MIAAAAPPALPSCILNCESTGMHRSAGLIHWSTWEGGALARSLARPAGTTAAAAPARSGRRPMGQATRLPCTSITNLHGSKGRELVWQITERGRAGAPAVRAPAMHPAAPCSRSSSRGPHPPVTHIALLQAVLGRGGGGGAAGLSRVANPGARAAGALGAQPAPPEDVSSPVGLASCSAPWPGSLRQS